MVGKPQYEPEQILFVLDLVVEKVKGPRIMALYEEKFGVELGKNQLRYIKTKYGQSPEYNAPLLNGRTTTQVKAAAAAAAVHTDTQAPTAQRGQRARTAQSRLPRRITHESLPFQQEPTAQHVQQAHTIPPFQRAHTTLTRASPVRNDTTPQPPIIDGLSREPLRYFPSPPPHIEPTMEPLVPAPGAYNILSPEVNYEEVISEATELVSADSPVPLRVPNEADNSRYLAMYHNALLAQITRNVQNSEAAHDEQGRTDDEQEEPFQYYSTEEQGGNQETLDQESELGLKNDESFQDYITGGQGHDQNVHREESEGNIKKEESFVDYITGGQGNDWVAANEDVEPKHEDEDTNEAYPEIKLEPDQEPLSLGSIYDIPVEPAQSNQAYLTVKSNPDQEPVLQSPYLRWPYDPPAEPAQNWPQLNLDPYLDPSMSWGNYNMPDGLYDDIDQQFQQDSSTSLDDDELGGPSTANKRGRDEDSEDSDEDRFAKRQRTV